MTGTAHAITAMIDQLADVDPFGPWQAEDAELIEAARAGDIPTGLEDAAIDLLLDLRDRCIANRIMPPS